MRLITSLGVSTLCLVAAAPVFAQKPTLTIPRTSEPPRLERFLDGTVTPPGVRVDEFKQREPGDGTPISQPTVAYLSYDDTSLYVVFVCRDEPGKVRANLTRREAITDDDFVGIVLDTYHDGRRSYLFIANPLGIQMDGVSTEGSDDDYSYDALWTSEGRVTPDGYLVVMAIPFRSMRFSNAHEQVWGVAVARVIARANETSFWPVVTKRISSFGQQLATLEGIEGVSPGRNLQAIPYASFAGARFLDEGGTRVRDTSGRAGIDAKAVIKDTVTLDVTVNPDFSQVESDEPQVTVNQRFEVFFPEKRPFFIENASYFETPEDVFFSRRVADPKFGTRVTGKTRGWSFGGLVANDEQPGRAVDAADPRAGRLAGVGVVRAQREFARQSYVGGVFTDREFGDTHNRVYGADGRWRIDDHWSVTGQWIGSATQDVGAAEQTGTSAFARVSRDGRGFFYAGEFLSRSPDFRADLGYIPRVDLRQAQNEAGYSWRRAKGRLLRFSADVETSVLWDYGGTLQEWTVEPGLEWEFPRQTEAGVRHWQWFERFGAGEFRHHTSAVYASTQWLSWLSGSLFYRWGTGINYYPADGALPALARRQNVEASLTVKPTSQLRLDQTYLFSRLWDLQHEVGASADADVFNNHVLRSRATYQFTRELSGRVILDYDAVLPNTSLVSLERQKRLNVDALFTYLVNPWTAVYIGYSDRYEDLLFDDLTGRPVGRGGAPTRSTGRQVFAKVSYLFRY